MRFGKKQGPAIRSQLFSLNLAILLFAQAVGVTGWFAVVTASGGILGRKPGGKPGPGDLAGVTARRGQCRFHDHRFVDHGARGPRPWLCDWRHGGRLRSSLCFPCNPDSRLRAALWRLDHDRLRGRVFSAIPLCRH